MKCINKIIPHGCTDENSSIKKQHSTILKNGDWKEMHSFGCSLLS